MDVVCYTYICRYIAASKLRRLRFIRRQIRARRYYDIEDVESDPSNNAEKPELPTAVFSDTHASVYNDLAPLRATYNREVLGEATDEEVEHLFLEAMQFGPEQVSKNAKIQESLWCSLSSCETNERFDRHVDGCL